MYPGLLSFKVADNNLFPERLFSKNTVEMQTPSQWWIAVDARNKKLSGEHKLPDGFCEYVSKLHDCPASSGSIERIFSTFGFVWSKVQNRLGSLKAQKLVKVYRFYRNC